MNNFSQKILKLINKNEIIPYSKKYFLIRFITRIVITILSTIAAATSFACFYFVSENRDLLILNQIYSYVFLTIFFTALFVYISYKNFYSIKQNYKIEHARFFLGASALIIFSVFILLQTYVYGFLDESLQKIHPELSIQSRVENNWSNPERGLLGGEVINVKENGILELKDFKGKIHTIDPVFLDDISREYFLTHLNVQMKGFQDSETFYPEEIKPWRFQHTRPQKHSIYNRKTKNQNIQFAPGTVKGF